MYYVKQFVEVGGISYPEYGYEEEPELIDKPFDELTEEEWNLIRSSCEEFNTEERPF